MFEKFDFRSLERPVSIRFTLSFHDTFLIYSECFRFFFANRSWINKLQVNLNLGWLEEFELIFRNIIPRFETNILI